ncbi:MAG: T9SS type A sorting domain-containing protein, partial [Saprospiraceae bacterium]|nr:T9SS type A sorting domain-containing protein [Saprospiraceae bacterium]
YQVADLVGHTATCSQQILVDDPNPPTITCPPNTTVSCASAAYVVDLNAVSATDNCAGLVKSHVKDMITNKICPNNFVLTRTFQVADGCGYTATCTSRIRVLDAPPPAVCPPNTTVSCAAEVPAAAADSFVFYDNCGDSISQVKWLGDAISNKTCENRYLITRSYRITDGCGNSALCSQKIQVFDQTAPVLVCPANVVVTCSAQIPAPTPGALAAQENCANGGALNISFSEAQVNTSCSNGYQIIRTYKATDLCGNTGACVQQITVDDQTPPTISCPANITVTCASQVPPLMPVMVAASDNCGGALTRFFLGDQIDAQVCANNFRINRVYAAADLCGNSASCTQIITILDQKPPTITCPANLTVNSTAAVPAPNASGIPAVGDNCTGGLVKSHLADLVSNLVCAEQYQLTRVYQAADACGNTTTCQQKITVDDRQAPTGQCPNLLPVACAADMPCDAADPSLPAFLQQIGTYFTDNSGVPVLVGVDSMLPVEDCTAGNNSFGRTIRYTISDACGNQTPCTVRYTGTCFCTYTQDFWGDPAGKIEGLDLRSVLDSLLKTGGITLGSHGSCGYTFSNPICIFKALPAGNEVAPFFSGNVPGCTGPWENAVAGQLLALQLNIRYNQAYRGRNLGAVPLAGSCLLDTATVKFLNIPANPTVQDLVAQANGYLLSYCFGDTTYRPGFGEKILTALRTLNEYWKDCGKNHLCPSGSFATHDPQDRSDIHTRDYESLETIRLMPNPVQDVLHVECTTNTPAQTLLRVFDAAGRQVLWRMVETGAGVQSIDLDVAGLRPGVYWLSWAGGALVVSRRFVVFRD